MSDKSDTKNERLNDKINQKPIKREFTTKEKKIMRDSVKQLLRQLCSVFHDGKVSAVIKGY